LELTGGWSMHNPKSYTNQSKFKTTISPEQGSKRCEALPGQHCSEHPPKTQSSRL